MLKKLLFVIFFLFSSTIYTFGQKIAFVDSEFILKHMPEYNSAIKELNAMSAQWQSEVDKMNDAQMQLNKAFEQDKAILTSEMVKTRQAEIQNKDVELKRYQQEKFGPEGELFQLRTRLIKPVQDRVAAAIKQVANDRRYDFIFDKNSDAASILFAAPNYDMSKLVIEKMGYKVNLKDKLNNIINQTIK